MDVANTSTWSPSLGPKPKQGLTQWTLRTLSKLGFIYLPVHLVKQSLRV
jgi:hypothetical protein